MTPETTGPHKARHLAAAAIFTCLLASQTWAQVFVLVGDATVPGETQTSGLINALVDEAVRDYERAGYDVVRRNSATANDFLISVLDSNALWFVGHGAYAQADGGAGAEVTSQPLPKVRTVDDFWISPLFLQNVTGMSTFDHIQQVTLMACGQLLPEWQALFPNAHFVAFDRPVRPDQMYNTQRDLTYPAFNPNFGALTDPLVDVLGLTDPAPSDFDVPAIHPSLQPIGQVYYDAAEQVWFNDLSAIANRTADFRLPDDLAATLEQQTINVFIDYGDGPELLFAATFEDGWLSQAASTASPTAAFDLILTQAGYRALLEDPDLWDSLAFTDATVVNHLGLVSDVEALEAFGQTYLSSEVPEPSSVLLLVAPALALAMGRSRRRTSV